MAVVTIIVASSHTVMLSILDIVGINEQLNTNFSI